MRYVKTLGEWRYTALVINVDIRYETRGWLDAPTAFPQVKKPSLSTEFETERVPEPVCTLRRPETYLTFVGNRKIISQTPVLSLFTVPIGLFLFSLFQNIVLWVGEICPVRLRRVSCMARHCVATGERFPDRLSFEQLSEMSGRRLQY